MRDEKGEHVLVPQELFNPELECATPEQRVQTKKLKSVDFNTVMERAEKAGYKVLFNGIDLGGIAHYKVIKNQDHKKSQK